MEKHYDQIHETVLGDAIKSIANIFSFVKDVNDPKKVNKNYIKSISSASKDLILVFPVLSSSAVSIEVQSMCTKAIERNCAEMLQLLFAAIQLTNEDDAREYIKKFHSNMSNKLAPLGIDDILSGVSYIDTMVKAAQEAAIEVGSPIDPKTLVQIREDMKNINYTLPTSVSESSISKFRVSKDGRNNTVVKEEVWKPAYGPYKTLDNSLPVKEKFDRADIRETKDATEIFSKQILSSDLKKANEMVPTMMAVNLTVRTDKGPVKLDPVLIGVKAKLYPIDSNEIIEHIVQKTQDSNWIVKLIQASTREISFFKDFLLAIDKAKIDAISTSRRGSSSRMWKALELRSEKSRWNRYWNRRNDSTPITTLLISQAEVEYIQKHYNIDFSKVGVIKKLLSQYNFLAVCIADESMETVKIIFDGYDEWEVLAFSSLEREASDNTYKKVVNLMSRVM